MSVLVSIGIGHGENVPVIVFGNLPDAGVGGSQQLIEDEGGGGRANPFPSVHSALDKYSGIALERLSSPLLKSSPQIHTIFGTRHSITASLAYRFVGDFHALDLATLVRGSTNDNSHNSRISGSQLVEPAGDLVVSVVRVPGDSARLDSGLFVVNVPGRVNWLNSTII